MEKRYHYFIRLVLIPLYIIAAPSLKAQTDVDAIMMNKNVLCAGAMYSYGSWKNYWEGTFKRNNENMGTVSTQMIGVMGNYGITNKINFLFSLPYVQTKATSGTLKGMKGVQDLSLMVKWMPFLKKLGNKQFISDYVADFLPMSIGLHSRNAMIRGMVDYQKGNFFATASGMYMYRSNVEIDRTSYYDSEMHLTNMVDMPNVIGYNVRSGYRSNAWIIEGVLENMTTLKGYDIRKNDMPFLTNKMIATMAGVNFKYSMSVVPGLELIAGARYTLRGRNMGQSTIFNGGVFYIMNFSKKGKTYNNTKTTQS